MRHSWRLLDIHYKINLALLSFALFQCSDHKEKLFVSTESAKTGIHFSNTIAISDSLKLSDYEYLFNGGGVAVGDINNDGLQDIYFTGNMVSSRLYLNKGNLTFEDITDKAGVGTTRWANGVVMVDINQDGFKDIFVSVGGNRTTPEKDRGDLLFINNHDATFTESAVQYGLADPGYGIQSAFLDYDGDGDLDMYLLRNAFVYNRDRSKPKSVNGEAASTDKLFRNNGDLTFTDISRQAGILIEGFGLGVTVSDINEDGWPDIYVSNDFITNDLLWINNRDGTFSNKAKQYLKHQTYNGMGNDVADYNNDGKVDIVVLDMLPEDNKRWKLTPRGNSYDKFQSTLLMGYEPQYVRNTLQLNNGNGTFSEIGQIAGIEATDWSWSSLFADFDNDGLKDLFITNGYVKDITNLDFIVYGDTAQMGLPAATDKESRTLLNEIPGIKVHNYIYKNRGDLTFADESESWGMAVPTFSNGAVYADLDNDGDLDLVVNNTDDEASIWECHMNQIEHETLSNYLRVSLAGPRLNQEGIGTKIYVRHRGSIQYQYFNPVHGYLSCVEPYLHFGLGALKQVDSVEVIWPDGKYQLMRNVKANQLVRVDYASATDRPAVHEKAERPTSFEEVTESCGIDYTHQEDLFVDFKVQPILPHMFSRNGPGVAVGDVNGDGMEDVYVGGAAGRAGGMFLQLPGGKFERKSTPGMDSLSEELGVLFFDADNDNDLDLYVVSGGSEQKKGSGFYSDHFYLNDGHGEFRLSADALPETRQSGSCVVAGDYDRDGDLDLFVGGRVVPGEYPMPPGSYLLRNDSQSGSPRFVNANLEASKGLQDAGMVCSALWSDYDNDGWLDLIVAGEFMSVRFYHNEKGKLIDATDRTGLENTSGWWNSLVGGDFDGDGDTDYLAGNLGLNSHFHATKDEPLCIYASDYNKDGRIDPVMSYYVQGEKCVGHPRDILIDQINSMRSRFRTYSAYANAAFEETFLPAELEDAYVVCAQRFESSYLENLGNGKFRITPLPLDAQFAPVYGMVTGDYNEDGKLDVLLVGNSYSPEVISGRDDASIGLYLRGDGKGNFVPVKVKDSGFLADNDSKGMAKIVLSDGHELMVVGNNSSRARAYVTRDKGRYYWARKDDAYAMVTLSNGKIYKHEFYYGSTYLSSSSRSLKLKPGIVSIKVFDFKGNGKQVAVSN